VYLFSRQFWSDLGLRLSGPGAFRFIIQPLVAIILGVRDCLYDAKAGRPPYVFGILFSPELRHEMWQTALASMMKPIIFAIILDAVFQHIILRHIHPGAAVIVGTFLMAVPYIAARGITNRIAVIYRRRRRRVDVIPGTS
jgi:hypothetical protein